MRLISRQAAAPSLRPQKPFIDLHAVGTPHCDLALSCCPCRGTEPLLLQSTRLLFRRHLKFAFALQIPQSAGAGGITGGGAGQQTRQGGITGSGADQHTGAKLVYARALRNRNASAFNCSCLAGNSSVSLLVCIVG